MTLREELFHETEKEIEGITEELRDAFRTLGEAVFADRSVLPPDMGVRLLEETGKALSEMEEAEEKEKEDTLFAAEYDGKKEEKADADNVSEELRKREKETRLKLGALIYEQCSLSLLDRSRFSSVYSDVEEEKALLEKSKDKSFWSRISSQNALSRMKKNDHSRYLDYSTICDNEENAVTISGENGRHLVEELAAIREERGEADRRRGELDSYLAEAVSRRRSLEKGGLEKDREDVAQKRDRYRECLINYGNYLYDRGGSWIGEDTPAPILDMIQRILETQAGYSSLMEKKGRLEREARADDFKVLVEEERMKIRILEEERERIDSQIAAIEKEIADLEEKIRTLENSCS